MFDEFSTDDTREIVKKCPKAEMRKYPFRGLDDERFLEAVNSWYKESRGKADFVIWADPDEILYHPEPLAMLANCTDDAIQVTGYGMISKEGPPDPKVVVSNIFDVYRMGVRQANYDKITIWRPEVNLQHQHGRHTYLDPAGGIDWPRGPRSVCRMGKSGWKLLHYHYFGVDYTAQRNRRNYARAVNKRFAWNYSADTEKNPKQNGTTAWVAAHIQANDMIDVISNGVYSKPKEPIKLHVGCGDNKLAGWENRDKELDIRRPLPFASESVSHILCEHCLEHISHREVWNFLEECRRVLIPKGVMRIAIPDFTKLQREMTEEYQNAVKAGGHGDGSAKAALRAVVFEHGHQSVWNAALLNSTLQAVGFDTAKPEYGKSSHPDLVGVEGHWKVVGRSVAETETSIVEGIKI